MIPRRRPNAPLQRLSRRGLITSGVLAGVLAASGLAVQAERRGGHLRLALPGRFGGWGLPDADLFARIAHQGAVFDTLTQIGPDGALRGELAESWQAADAGAAWTLRLRDGTVFHDGRPVTAADVVASLLLADPAALPGLAGIYALDMQTVAFELAAPDANWPFRLAHPALVIGPGGDLAGGIGSGLYRPSGTQDGALHLLRVALHARDGQAGWFDHVTLLPSDDTAMRLALLRSGQADAAVGLDQVPPGFIGVMPATALFEASAGERLVLTQALRHSPLGAAQPADATRAAERWWFA
jgi:peptide/nickel transport system substrate-binding protein